MEDEIDLRVYIDVLIRRWKWIVVVTMLAASLAGVVSFVTPPTYEATATLTVLQGSSPVLASPAGQLAVLQSSNSVLVSPAAQLAVLQSSDVATQTLQMLGQNAAGENASIVARRVRVVADARDKTLFRVTAQAVTPQQAAALANAWAQAGVVQMNRQFITKASAAKEQQAQLALEPLKQADAALASFVQGNGLTWDDVAIFQGSTRIVIQNSSKPLSLSAAQIVELSRLLRDRDVAASVYANLATQAAQSKIASQSPGEGAQFISLAAEPASPTQPKPLQNVAIATVVGLMAGVLGVFVVEYFAKPRTMS